MKTAIFCVVILALMQTLLGVSISACRWVYKKSVGRPDDPNHPMNRISVAYTNCAEWHPAFYALLLVQPMQGGPMWALWLGPLAVTARCLLVTGLLTFSLKKPNVFRFVGAGLTYFTLLALCGVLLSTYR